MKNDESIDLGDLWKVILGEKKVIGGVIGACIVGALIVANLLPKQYSSTTVVQTRNASRVDVSGAKEAMSLLGMGGGVSANSTSNYVELMKTRAVLEPIIDSIDWQNDGKPDASGFAAKNLTIKTTKGTNLITITGKGRSPEEAQTIASGVVENFLLLQTNSNQQTQSLLVRFLDERINNAKQDADIAARRLAEFQKDNHIYSPDDQAKLVIQQLDAYDKAISDMQVEQKAAQAQYDVAVKKLEAQKRGALNYNINENATVQDIRSQIVKKEVELVELNQKFTAQHPDVIAANNQLNKLHAALSDEVSAIVNSNAVGINGAYLSLYTDQAKAEAQISAAEASEKAIKEKREDKEKEAGQLPDAMVTYMQLEAEAKIKQQIYTSLVQQCEQDKIQEAMEAMDIQIIDKADLPKGPSGPQKKIIVFVGSVVGILLSLIYSLLEYRRRI